MPLERMQLANLSAPARGACAAELAVVVEPLPATPFEGDPPQAASSRTPPANTVKRTNHRGVRPDRGPGALSMRLVMSGVLVGTALGR